MTVPGRRGMDLLINDNNKYLLQTKIHNDNKKAKHSKRTEHIIFKEANPWKLIGQKRVVKHADQGDDKSNS